MTLQVVRRPLFPSHPGPLPQGEGGPRHLGCYEEIVKIVIPGGSGQVGTVLARAFQQDRHQVVVLSRAPHKAPWRIVPWDAATLGPWASELNGADVVINLAGRK